MNALRISLASLALAMLAVLPAGAGAASLVPPGNSAANQYTETFPTTGGNAEAEGKGKGKGKATPGDVLGAGNSKKLDSKGKQGRETAAVVAATAPPPVTGSAAGAGNGSDDSGAAGAGGSGGGQTAAGGSAGGGPGSATSEVTVADAEGSSGVGEVLGQATGSSSSGGIGLLLPLVVLGSVIWALAFFLRRRRRTA
ncbi:MAG TPA: hypothetical protein VFY48_00910 [Solirubrobacterales bacterium]|nr:hypothetical protein [Solirubrobacterales bacterium]